LGHQPDPHSRYSLLLRRFFLDFGGFFFDGSEVAVFAAVDEAFGDGFEFFPAGADGGGFGFGDFVVGGGDGDDGEEVGEFLDDHVGRGDEEIGMSPVVFWVFDEETSGALANPLDEAEVVRAFDEGFDAVEGVGGAAAAGFVSLGPFVDERLGKAHVGGDLLDVTLFKNFAKKFVGLHGGGLADAAREGNSVLVGEGQTAAGEAINTARKSRENLTV
jgi:hypothetical protein